MFASVLNPSCDAQLTCSIRYDDGAGTTATPTTPRRNTALFTIGATAEDISLALSAVVPGEVTGVTIPGLSSANVYASFRSAAAAAAAKVSKYRLAWTLTCTPST